MTEYFGTDKSGKTVHIQNPRRSNTEGLCGVTNANTQWTRAWGGVADGDRVCQRCKAAC